jgi:acyl-homoserine lactone acylase PvdQ
MITRSLAVALVLGVALTSAHAGAAATPTQPFLQPGFLNSIDDAQLHGTITPPGADNAHATTEIAAYDDLVQGYPKLTMDELSHRYFKTRLFGAPLDAGRTYEPRAGVTVVRDSQWGEPHIFGDTDGDMAFGAGWVAAEDRLPIMELLRALGRAEAFQLLGTTPAWLADMEMARLYGYTEEEWQAQLDRLPRVYGKPGADIVAMIDEYVKGVNAYITSTGQTAAPWKPTDVVAAVSTVRALFGAGGGSEMNDAAVLAGLNRDFGPKTGREIYEDFRSRNNADGPVHTVKRFPYEERDPTAIDPKSTAVDTSGSDSSAAQLAALAEQSRIHWERLKLTTPYGVLNLSHPNSMSNHLVVGASRTTNGRPLLLGGPQAGYFSPEILMDYEIHSPTIHARGAGFPGLSTIVVMGRTQDYAWSPTAGGSDMIDTYVEKLCDPNGGAPGEDSRYYEFKGKCIAMDRRTLRQAPPGAPYPDLIAERTVHGPVVARSTLKGIPVAVSQKRSTYGKEIDAAVSILKMNRDEAKTGDDFVTIFRESHNLSTNWSYVNDHEIAYVHGGLYPIRPKSVDPDLPVWGTGQWEWKTDEHGNDVYLGREQVPYEVAPKRDYFVSWNNRPAPGWNGSDAQWGWSSIYRAKLLEDAILAQKPHSIDPVRLVQMMEQAGLTDLRGRYVLPLALRVLEPANGVGPREQKMIELLRQWVAAGSLRRDGDKNGDYDQSAAVAIMDAWWEKLIRAVYDPVIGDAARIPLPFDNAPSSGGSAYQDGFYGYLWTDFSQVLGDKVKSPTSRIYCGGSKAASGNLSECAKRVLASLASAGDQLASDHDTADPAQWKSDAEGERIRFLPGAALSMQWVNRPTTQQIAMFGRLDRPAVLRLVLHFRHGRGGCARGRVRPKVAGRDFRRVEAVRLTVGRSRVRAKVRLRGGDVVTLARTFRRCS